MRCPSCSNENLDDAQFCDRCGAELGSVCPACKTRNRAGAQVCTQCRAPLPASEQLAGRAPTAARFCPECGSSSPDQAQFCTNCSASLSPVGLPLADFGARAGAFIADIVLFSALSGFVSLFVRVLFTTSVAGLALSWLPILVGVAPFVFFWGRAQSPGKAALGLQVVNRDGAPANMAQMLGRALLKAVGLILTSLIIGFVWYLWPLWDKERRAPHDMILGTHVVRKGRKELREA